MAPRTDSLAGDIMTISSLSLPLLINYQIQELLTAFNGDKQLEACFYSGIIYTLSVGSVALGVFGLLSKNNTAIVISVVSAIIAISATISVDQTKNGLPTSAACRDYK